jgi:hypothetical protein
MLQLVVAGPAAFWCYGQGGFINCPVPLQGASFEAAGDFSNTRWREVFGLLQQVPGELCRQLSMVV